MFPIKSVSGNAALEYVSYEIGKNNYLASVSIFSAAISNKVKRIIFCSSMARYGSQKYPFTEDMKASPADPYAISKVAAEQNSCKFM